MNDLLHFIVWGSVLVCGGMLGCASTVISLDTNPSGALVFVKPLGVGEFRELGKTPIVLEAKDIVSSTDGSGPVNFRFKLEDHSDEEILVTELNSVDLKITKKLSKKIDEEKRASSALDLNSTVNEFFEVQRLVRANNLEEALVKINRLAEKHPKLAVTYELKGGVYLFQQRLNEALDAYQMAVALDPTNLESVQVRDFVAARLGIDLRKEEKTGRLPAAEAKVKTPGNSSNSEAPPSLPKKTEGSQ